MPAAPFNLQLFALGMIVTLIAIGGWLWDAMREWRATSEPRPLSHGLPAGTNAAVALLAWSSAAVQRRRTFGAAAHGTGRTRVQVSSNHRRRAHARTQPVAILRPDRCDVILYGFIFSSVLIVGGIFLTLIALTGWYLEAGHEYRSTEAVGHAVPATRDPYKAWPRRLVPIYFSVIAISFAITLVPFGLDFLNSLDATRVDGSAAQGPGTAGHRGKGGRVRYQDADRARRPAVPADVQQQRRRRATQRADRRQLRRRRRSFLTGTSSPA